MGDTCAPTKSKIARARNDLQRTERTVRAYLSDMAAICTRTVQSTDPREMTTALDVLSQQYQVAAWIGPSQVRERMA